MNSKSVLIFHHIPKAGGTTLSGILMNNFRPNEVIEIHAPTKWQRWAACLGELSARPEPALILGHMPLGVHRYMAGGDARYMSFVRDPIKRVVSLLNDVYRRESHYLHTKLHRVLNERGVDGLLDADFSEEVCNETVRYFSSEYKEGRNELVDLDKAKDNVENLFDFIGVLENYDESLLLLRKKVGLQRIYYQQKNVGTLEQLNFTPEHIERIRELNSLDVEFYGWIAENFSATVESELRPDEIAKFRSENEAYGKHLYALWRGVYKMREKLNW